MKPLYQTPTGFTVMVANLVVWFTLAIIHKDANYALLGIMTNSVIAALHFLISKKA
ncbi:hypothetical protein SAMN04488128_103204 [Chitinophaga eiseniae]|uniref:Uncharacterized protein n=1 Tax=Chitinophaga eiseniae TaxID=634771 RepID=A0A1T4SP52_9BACT|nr:hypothetical protein [Chitinophaga eiseniae]SKA30019.1 hypothetical protein SAMN04488128_103204 [Chitinophaga eiseniae]